MRRRTKASVSISATKQEDDPTYHPNGYQDEKIKARRRRKRSPVVFFGFDIDFGLLIFTALVFVLGVLKHYYTGISYSQRSILWFHKSKSRSAVVVNEDTTTTSSSTIYRPKYDAQILGYDIYNCPSKIPIGYPKTWNSLDILRNWNPNDTGSIPPQSKTREIYQGLCIFDYGTQYETALLYRNADMPFVIRNDPNVVRVSTKWSDPHNLLKHLSNQLIYTERSTTNHFTFYREDPDTNVDGWTKPPNDFVMMSFEEWLDLALVREYAVLQDESIMNTISELRKEYLEQRKVDGGNVDNVYRPEDDVIEINRDTDSREEKQKKWYYLRLNGWVEDVDVKSIDKFLFDELTFFDPRISDSDFYLFPKEDQNGINCRFGMRGIVAETHYDNSRNMLAVLEGERRYVIGHPSECKKLDLYPWEHPSARHSFDWSNPALWDVHPNFKDAQLSEVVLEAGDVMFLPTSWFHYIINLSKNIQCNSSSGSNPENDHYLEACGFG